MPSPLTWVYTVIVVLKRNILVVSHSHSMLSLYTITIKWTNNKIVAMHVFTTDIKTD